MENNYDKINKYTYILIDKDTLTFATNNTEELTNTIIDVKNNFGNCMFPNIEIEIIDSLTLPIKKHGVIIENYETLMADSTVNDKQFEKANQKDLITIEEAKKYFNGIGNESVYMLIQGVRVPIFYNGLKIDLTPGWEKNIGKYHPDVITLKLFGEAMDKFEEEFEPKIMN